MFIVSNEPWGSQWFVKHHYANELAKLGCDVYFLNPVKEWSAKKLLHDSVGLTKVRDRLSVAEYSNALPVRLAPFTAAWLNDRFNAAKMRPLARGRRILVWQFDPFRFAHNAFGGTSRKIYHVADHYADLPFDAVSARNANLVVCTSERFVAHYSVFGRPVLHIPHAISSDDLAFDAHIVEGLRRRYGKYLLYAGSMNDRMDIGILREVCRAFPAYKLVVLGPNQLSNPENRRLFEECRSYPTFVYEGVVDAGLLRNYINGADACLVAYDFNERQTLGPITSSLKVLHYLAQRKPIVSSSDIEYADLQGRAIFYARDIGEYLNKLRDIFAGRTLLDHRAVDRFLASHTYASFIRNIFDALSSQEPDAVNVSGGEATTYQ